MVGIKSFKKIESYKIYLAYVFRITLNFIPLI